MEAVDEIADFVKRERRRKAVSFALARQGSIAPYNRAIDDWDTAELPDAELAAVIFRRAKREMTEGLAGEPSFVVHSMPSGRNLSFRVPMAFVFDTSSMPPQPATAEGALAQIMALTRRGEENAQKFVAALVRGALESSAVNRLSFKDREDSTAKIVAQIVGHYENVIKSQDGIIAKLLDERAKYIDAFIADKREDRVLEIEARRESLKSSKNMQMVWKSVITPVLPQIISKIQGAFGKPKTGAAKPGEDGAAAAAAPAADASGVTGEQASALWAMFQGLEITDLQKMAAVLSDVKRVLLLNVFEAFFPGSTR